MDWLSILGNVSSGGLFGLLGTGFSFAMGYFQKKQEHRQRLEWAIEERETLKIKGQLAAAQTAGEIVVAREKGAADAFVESQKAERSIARSYPWVDAIRGVTRPFLTFFLILVAVVMRYSADPATRAYIDQNIVVTAVASVTWWFGQRQLDKSTVAFGNSTSNAQAGQKT